MLDLNKIYHMDCREGLKLLDKDSVDYVITSPPYNLKSMVAAGPSALGKRKKIDYKDNMSIDDYYTFIYGVILDLIRVTKKYILIL